MLIWKELMPERRPPDNSRPREQCLGILATSRQLYHEVRRALYSNRVITFQISPNPVRTPDEPFNRQSTIDVSDQLGSTWSLYPRFHRAREDQAESTALWERLPFRKLKGVNFELMAPDPDSPAELLQMWNKLCWLVVLLQYARRFPKVEVHVLERPERKWSANGKLNHSIVNVPVQLRKKSPDLQILLSCFRRLRGVKQMEVKLPFEHKHKSLNALVSEVSFHAVSKEQFGFKTGEEEDMNDDVIAMEEDTWTVWFDQILDDLPGLSARFARLERFWNWCSHYETRMWERINCDECPLGGAVLLTLEEKHGVLEALSERLSDMPAFNSMSFKQDREQGEPTTGCEILELPEDVVTLTGKEGWCSAKWWTFHHGIPRKSHWSYERHLESYRYFRDEMEYRRRTGHPRLEHGRW